MAGVIGMTPLSSREEQTLDEIHRKLSHRGPDSSGKTMKCGALDVRVAHHRLSIQDTSYDSNQPMFSPRGSVLVYNGEIYNANTLRESLKRDWDFRTTGDTEVLLALLETRGAESVSKVEGIFSFAFVNSDSSEVLLGRDRLGVKPLYWARIKNQIWFASESSPLGQCLKSELDPISFHEWALFQFPISNRTFYEGVNSVPQAHIVSITRDRIKEKRYWNFEDFVPNNTLDRTLDPDDFIELCELSIREQLISDVPIASFCSGGIDSSLITTIGAKYGLSKGFVGDYEIPGFSESAYASQVCTQAGIPLEIVKITSDDYFKALPKVISALDFPVAGPGSVGQYLVTKRASVNFKVMLSGSGGDELFLGYTRDLLTLLASSINGIAEGSSKSAEFWKNSLGELGSLSGYAEMLKLFANQRGFVHPLEGFIGIVDRRSNLGNLFNLDEDIVKRVKSEVLARISPNGGESVDDVHNSLLRYENLFFLSSLLQVEDRVSMASGVEIRVPLLSTRILEAVLPLSINERMRGGRAKDLMRRGAEKLLPMEVSQRKDKMGFPVPFLNWIETGNGRNHVAETISNLNDRNFPFLQSLRVDEIKRDAGLANRSLWAMLSLEAWLSSH